MFLGLDVGTSAVKAAVFHAEGALLGTGRAATPWRGMELDPPALVAAVLEAAATAVDGRRVAGVGVASMAETGVLVDIHGLPVVPSIHWDDPRGAEQAARLAAEVPDFSARSGLPASRMCSLAKYAWMRAHWPAAERGARWVSLGDWIVEQFGGAPGAEPSLASRTGFYDIHTVQPREEVLAWAQAPRWLALLPERGARGRAKVDPLRGAVLAVAGHDHVAAAIGAGAVGEGDVFDSGGTAEAIQRAVSPLPPDAVARAVEAGFTVGMHALPGLHVLQGAFWSGAPTQDAEILARMAELAGPVRRIVASGGRLEDPAARAAKERRLGPFEYVPDVYTGCRGAAFTAATCLDS